MEIIKIDNLTKDYGNNRGVFNLSFSVEKGEVFGFLGPNGAGKTTTIRNLMGFIHPDSGNCTINGLDCFTNSAQIQKDIGYIPGEISFMNEMTGMEFIKFIANYRGVKDFKKAEELIQLFELDPRTKIKKMSKGTKQKIGIVVAFMHNPSILILDEPTSGLDPLMQNRFVELVNEEKKKGKTIIISSHMFEEVEKTCTRVLIIKEGKIVAVDDIEQIKKSKSKKFTITFESENSALQFSKSGFDIKYINENIVSLHIQDNINEFIKILSGYRILDMKEEQQNLESIFMSYYGGNHND